MPQDYDSFEVWELHWDPSEYSKRMLVFFLFKKNAESSSSPKKMLFTAYISTTGKFENAKASPISLESQKTLFLDISCIKNIEHVKTLIDSATKLPKFEFRIFQSCKKHSPKYTNIRLESDKISKTNPTALYKMVHLENHVFRMSEEVYDKSKDHHYCLMQNLNILFYEEGKFKLYGIVDKKNYEYFDFDSATYKFEKVLRLLCFSQINFATVVGELAGAHTEYKKKKPRIGVLTLHIGSAAEMPSIKNRVFDYFTLDFNPEDPEQNIVGFVKSNKDSSDNELKKYIYLNFRYFRKNYRRRIFLGGPDLHLGSKSTSVGIKILKIKAQNARTRETFDFRFNIKRGIDPIKIVPNQIIKVEKKIYTLKELGEFTGPICQITLVLNNALKAKQHLDLRRRRTLEKNSYSGSNVDGASSIESNSTQKV